MLEDASGAMVTGVRFGDDGAWPSSADGGGQSLERVDAQGPTTSRPAGRPVLNPVAAPVVLILSRVPLVW